MKATNDSTTIRELLAFGRRTDVVPLYARAGQLLEVGDDVIDHIADQTLSQDSAEANRAVAQHPGQ